MRIFLHIGDGKAGSSSIQASLATAQKALLEKGILYFSENVAGHYRIAPYVLEPDEAKRNSPLHENARNIIRNYNRLIASNRPHTIVLSAESFFSPNMASRLNDLLNHFDANIDEVRVICYVRSPAQRYLSQSLQSLKAGRPILHLSQYQTMSPRVIDAWKDAIGKDKLIVRFLDRSKIVDGCVTQDIQSALSDFVGFAVDDMSSVTANESMPPEQAILLQHMSATSEAPGERGLVVDIQDVTRFLNAARGETDLRFNKARISKNAFNDLQPETDAFEAYMVANYPELDVTGWFADEKAENSTGPDTTAEQGTIEYLFRTVDQELVKDIECIVPRLNPDLATPAGIAAALDVWWNKHPKAVRTIYKYWATSEAMEPDISMATARKPVPT